MRALSLILAAMLLSSCAGEVIEKRMSGMVGQPLSRAVEKLGLPTDERQIAGQKVYIWARSRLVEGTTSACQIRAIMRGDVIDSFDYEGNNGACMYYAGQLGI